MGTKEDKVDYGLYFKDVFCKNTAYLLGCFVIFYMARISIFRGWQCDSRNSLKVNTGVTQAYQFSRFFCEIHGFQ